jgi:hypothetical protein
MRQVIFFHPKALQAQYLSIVIALLLNAKVDEYVDAQSKYPGNMQIR